MQKVAAYLLERRLGLESSQSRATEYEQCLRTVREWLKYKGAVTNDYQAGSYQAEDQSKGKFRWESALDGERAWQVLCLDETAVDGTRHLSSVSVTNTGSSVAIYVTVEVGLSFSTIKPLRIDPRCPRIVRSLLGTPGNWYHGHSQLFKLQRISGIDGGKKLAREITDQQRTVPVLLISEDEGFLAIPGLDKKAAYDLTGLTNTYVLNSEASWGLTGTLGKKYSCFAGGVRIYWPKFTLNDNPFSHPLWTSNHLIDYSSSFETTDELFRRQLRQMFMQASALSVLRPREIDEIQAAARSNQLQSLMKQAESGADFEQLAHSYAKDNDALRAELDDLRIQNHKLVNDLEATRSRLGTAESLAGYREQDEQTIAPLSPDDASTDSGPEAGEIRFYKKTHSTPNHDVMVLVADCGCNCWQAANKADKAKKGIKRFEGRGDWKTIQHCGKCTGGGMWKVRW